LAATVREGGNEIIQVYEWQNDRTTKLTGVGRAYDAVWSPDGRYVVFASAPAGGYQMLWTRADGASQPQPLLPTSTGPRLPWSFSPDGKWLAYFDAGGNGRGNDYSIWTVPVEDQRGQLKAGTPEQFLKDQVVGEEPSFSPDGKWLAYSSGDSGTREVYVRPFQQPPSGSGGKWTISTQGGESPVWSRKSPDLLYLARGGQIMAVHYSVKDDVFVADKPRVWEPMPMATPPTATNFDLSPDGKRLAVIMPVASPEAPKPEHEVVFLQNFFDELRRRVPVGK
jgi:serine/threonine-protein kinase